MIYLQPTDYLTYGLDATTDQSWVTAASAVIDAHCRRSTLGVNQYEERLKLPPELNNAILRPPASTTIALPSGTSPLRATFTNSGIARLASIVLTTVKSCIRR